MSSTTDQTAAPPAKNLVSRIFGVLFSPRDTYEDIVARPRVLGVLLTIIVVMAAANYLFLSTDVGQRAYMDQSLNMQESFGRTPNPQAIQMMQRMAPYAGLITASSIVVAVPLVMTVMTGILLVIFNAIMGGEASFKQVFSVLAFSGVIGALQQAFVMPLNYVRETMSSATSLSVFLPMVDDKSFFGMLLGSIDLFRIWSTIVLAIGLAVLYRRRTAPIAWSLLAVFFVIIVIVAGVRAALSGA